MSEVRFAQSGDVHVAYRVVGDGPVDLIFVQSAFTHLDVFWDSGVPALLRAPCRGLEFEDRGTVTLKGIPGEWRLFAVRA